MTAIQFMVGPNGILPTRGSDGAAGFDLYASEDVHFTEQNDKFIIPTDVYVSIPQGYVGLIRDRSSAHKKDLFTVAGVIDSDYRGTIGVVTMFRWSGASFYSVFKRWLNFKFADNTSVLQTVRRGERIAQLVVVPCLTDFEVVNALDETKRGINGYGSTGI